jgi:CubicO group peptidase (beta-lactamase class C family)
MPQALEELDACLRRLVARGGPPGTVLAVRRDGALAFERAYGAAELPEAGAPERPARTDTIFDLGSITKVVVTTAVVMSLVEAGTLDLQAPVSSWLDAFAGPAKRRVTLAHLLTHRAGLWEWWPVYFRARDPAAAIEFVCALELRYPVDAGRHYSDLGFMLLGEIVRRATGEELDAVARRLVLDPLGMRDTCFLPPPALRPRIAATSRGDRHEREMVATGQPYPVRADAAEFHGWREHTLVGEVNDGNAHHAFGGVAGHAGLFSTARDLAAFGQALVAGGGGVWEPATVRHFTRDGADPGQGLGFWTRRHAGDGFGHGGFPGTELLVSPERGLVVVLLTNRLHARRQAGPIDAPWREILRILTA